jgi:arylsulfatase A-like enzyme
MHGRAPRLSRGLTWTTGLLLVLVIAFAAFHTSSHRKAGAARYPAFKASGPNLLILIGDDHAAYTLGVDGDTHGATPRIDALARQGVYLRRAYCNSPLCTPSRQSIITGRLPHAVGVTRLQTPLPESAVTLGDWLGDHGYETAAVGKMHFNSTLTHGFDTRIDTPEWEKWLKTHLSRGVDHRLPWHPFRDPARVWLNADHKPCGLPDRAMEATYFADQAADYIRRHKDGPFALVVGFNEPHSPFKFPDDWPHRYSPEAFEAPTSTPADRAALPKVFQGLTPEEARSIRAAYYTSISYVDSKVGHVLDALDASGLADNTVVVYLGDNGYMTGQHGRFEKHCFYEPAVRIPVVIRWPKGIKGGRQITEMIEGVDLLPTLLELLGVDAPPGLHGRSMADLVRGKAGGEGRSYIFSEYLDNEEAMIADSRHKLIVGTGARKRTDGYVTDVPTPGPYVRLYDRESDPNEDVDLADRPEMADTKRWLIDALFERITSTRNPDDQAPPGLDKLATIRRCLVPKD